MTSRGESGWRVVRMAVVLALFWLALSAHFDPLLLTLGVVSVVVVCVMAWRAGLYEDHGITASFALRLPRYLLWLIRQVLSSAVGVLRKVWSLHPDLQPVVAPTPVEDLAELWQVIYANSITLTPGTVSLDVSDVRIEVHSLDQAAIDELQSGVMLDRVRRTSWSRVRVRVRGRSR